MDYRQAMEFIEGASGKGDKKGTANMLPLLARLGNPHKKLRAFHVAGTNGKGSICALLDSALQEAGYRTGLYTSPHLERFNDRMRLCGRPISDLRLAEVTSEVAAQVEILRRMEVRPTFFEICTAVAFLFFAEENVDYAIIEVGLGGRLDSTNVITPMVSLIASIGFDHMKTLGNTLAEIAGEKAGIIKPDVPVVTNPQVECVRRVFEDKCAQSGSALYDLTAGQIRILSDDERGSSFALEIADIKWPEVEIGLPGIHQAQNASCALTALTLARRMGLVDIADAQILSGFKRARWPGRLEWVGNGPAILLDGAHNGPGARTLLDYAKRHLAGRHVVLLCAMLGDKPVEDVVRQVACITNSAVVTQVSSARALEPRRLAALLEANGVSCRVKPDLPKALDDAVKMAGPDGVVLVTGSLYLVGEVRALLNVDDGRL